GNAPALNVGFSANLLRHIERTLKRLVQPRAGMAALQRKIVGFLQLPENLRLSEHHGIQTTGNLEEVMHTERLVQHKQFITFRHRLSMLCSEKIFQLPTRLRR